MMSSEPPANADDLDAMMNGDQGPTPPAPDAAAPPEAGASMGKQDCVPLSALNMPDESEQMQSPEVGDNVQYTVEGKVAKIAGDQAYIERDTINGQPVNSKPEDQNPAQPPDGGDGDGDEAAGLQDLQSQASGVQLQ